MAINAIAAITGAEGAAPANKTVSGAGGAGFGDALQDLIGAVEGSAGEANKAVGNMLDGTGDVHEAMLALQKADTMLQLTVQIRNKLVQAYQDVMRMPV